MYLGVVFMSEGIMEREVHRQIGVASAVTWTRHRSVMVKTVLSRKVKLLILYFV